MGRTISLTLFTFGTVCAVALTGCSSGTSSTRAAQPDVARTVKAALAKVRTAELFRVVVAGKDDGEPIGLDLHYGTNGVEGSVAMNGSTVALKITGNTVFFKAPDSFWREQAGSDDEAGAAAVERLGGKWVKTSKQSAGGKDFADIADSSSFLEAFTADFDDSAADGFERTGTSKVGGMPTTTYGDASGKDTIDIAASGYPLRLTSQPKKNDGGSVVFGDWNEPFVVQPPKSSITLPS